MIDLSDTHRGTDAAALTAGCALCGGAVGRGRHVQADDWSLAIFCTEACFRAAAREQRRRRWQARRRAAKWCSVGAIFVGGLVAPHQGPAVPALGAHAALGPRPAARALGPVSLPPGWFGPEWPPTELSVLAALGRDAWVHPLPGPHRRMPRTDARVFGAERPGDRAVECRNGHCGVDLGGELWGEHVHAVHDGVVDWVQRGANPERGGRFVRLSHRNGTLFTQYFHLAAIPRGLERGKPVKSGEVVGLLGDSGVKDSAPHLHFTISIRSGKTGHERYIDPEPLVALWPLRVPLDGSEVGLVTTIAEPAMPLGSALLRPGRRRTAGRSRRAAPDPAADPAAPSPSEPETTAAAAASPAEAEEPPLPRSPPPMPEAAAEE